MSPERKRPSVTDGWTQCERAESDVRCNMAAFTGERFCPEHAAEHARILADRVGETAGQEAVDVLHHSAHAGGACFLTVPTRCPEYAEAEDIIRTLTDAGFVIGKGSS